MLTAVKLPMRGIFQVWAINKEKEGKSFHQPDKIQLEGNTIGHFTHG
jgi:hypothetical protein